MIDLSNNNPAASFRTVRAAGQRRVYLKLTEGVGFVDGKHDAFRTAALQAGLKVGEYHFARPHENSAKDEAEFFCSHLPHLANGKTLRPCLDLEEGTPSPAVGQWAEDFVHYVRAQTGHRVVLYTNPYYGNGCRFAKPFAPLWLAAYARNDGHEYPFEIPKPWKRIAAHQYSSQGHVPGVQGLCDVSHVRHPLMLDVHRWPLR